MGKILILTHIFQMGWNHQPVKMKVWFRWNFLFKHVIFKFHWKKKHFPFPQQFAQSRNPWERFELYIGDYTSQLYTWATKKTLITFHYTGWLIGILIMVYYNPYILGSIIPYITQPTRVFFVAHLCMFFQAIFLILFDPIKFITINSTHHSVERFLCFFSKHRRVANLRKPK